MAAAQFLRDLIAAIPYRLHKVLTDNGIQFANRSCDTTAFGVCQRSCHSYSFSGCAFFVAAHGASSASFMGERVVGPMVIAVGIGSLGVQPDRTDRLPVPRAA